jgi:hypothetical protein
MVEGFFIHRSSGKQYLFAVTRYARRCEAGPQTELMLEWPTYEIESQQRIIAVTRIQDKKAWMVRRYDGSLLFLDFDVYYM